MPILNIEVIGEVTETIRDGLASRLADAAGTALKSRPQGTWVKLYFLSDNEYSENDGGPPAGALPIIVTLIQAEVPEGPELLAQVQRLTTAIAQAVGRPAENVHIIIEPAARGRIAFGGKLRL